MSGLIYVCPGCGWTGELSETDERNIQGKWRRGYCPKGGTRTVLKKDD